MDPWQGEKGVEDLRTAVNKSKEAGDLSFVNAMEPVLERVTDSVCVSLLLPACDSIIAVSVLPPSTLSTRVAIHFRSSPKFKLSGMK